MFGLGLSLFQRAFRGGMSYVYDNLKLFFSFQKHQDTPISHASAGSTSFDGTDDYIDCGNDSSLNITGSITYTAWIKTSTNGKYIIGNEGSTRKGGLRVYTNVVNIIVIGDAVAQRHGTVTVTDGEWHHVAGVYDLTAETLNVYTDGILNNGTLTGTIADVNDMNSTTNGYDIGRESNGGGELFNGSIANVGIWSRALSASEVQGIMYKKYADLGSVDKTSLVSWYGLDATSLGSELVSNGAFDTDTTGWTAADSATVTWQSGRMRVDGNTGTANQAITTIVGKTYTISADMFLGTSASVAIYISTTTSTGGTISSQASSGSWNFTATATTLYVICRVNAASATYVEFDNISIKELTLDDAHSTNHGSPVGSTTNSTIYGDNAPSKPRIFDSAPDVVDNYGTLKSGTALSFDGTNDRVSTPATNNLSGNDTYTFSAWIKPDATTTEGIMGIGAVYMSICIIDGYLEVFNWDGGAVQTNTDEHSISSGQWYHVVGVFESGNVTLYKNGKAGATVSASNQTASNQVFYVGFGGNSDYFDGSISSVKVFDSALTLSEIQEMYLNPEQILPTGVSSSNLKLHLPMNEGSGAYNYDGSGNQNHGTISGATWVKAETDIAQVGLVRQNLPMVFDGSDDYVSIGTTLSYTNNTFSAWIKPEANSSADRRVIDATDANDDGLLIYVRGDSDKIQYSVNGSGLQSASTYNGQWVYIVGTYDGSTQKLYINGSLDQSTSTSQTISTSTNAIIGARSFTSQTTPFKGLINEVAVWDVALDADAITALYGSGTPLLPTSDSGNYDNSGDLQGYWRNDNDTTWTDRTPLGAYGSELVANGGFDADSNWSKESGWAISGGTANCTASSTGALYQTGYTGGQVYEVTYTISNRTSGGIYLDSEGGNSVGTVPSHGTLRTANGTYTEVMTLHSGGNLIAFRGQASTSTSLSLDNVSVKKYRGGNDGTVAGTPASIVLTEGLTSGRDSQGFYLTNTDENVLTLNGAEYVEVPDSDTLSFGDGSSDSPFSVEAWVKTDDVTDFEIVSKGVYNTSGEYRFLISSNDSLYLSLYDESGASTYEIAYTTSTLTAYEGQWVHVCATYNGVGGTSANAGITIYVNGVSQSLTLIGYGTYVAMENLSVNMMIGRHDSAYSNGKIDDVRIYSDALSATEVTKNWNAGLSKHRN